MGVAEPRGGVIERLWDDERARQALVYVLLFLITIPLLTKIFTSDFGTHIALGRQIVQTRSIADKEFLNYPSLGMRNINTVWLFQTILYLVFSAGGVYGVSAMIWVVVLAIYLLMHRAMVIRGANPFVAILAIFAFSGFLRIRIQPRPELFTYLYIAATIYLLTEYYYGKRKKLIYVFPPLALVWGNTHPSYLIAFVLSGAFFGDALVRAAWNRQLQWERLKGWVVPPLAVGLAGLLLVGLNPNGYESILTPIITITRGAVGGGGGAGNHVMMSISELTPVKNTGLLVYYKAAVVFAATSLVLGAIGGRVYLLDLFLFAIAFKGSWDASRAVSMMGLFIAPGNAIQLTGFLAKVREWGRTRAAAAAKRLQAKEAGSRKEKGKKKPPEPPPERVAAPPPARPPGAAVLAAALAAVALLAFGTVNLSFSFSQLEYGVGITEHKFSFKAAEFLRANPIPGNMFNFFDVGGFLDWQLYPDKLTFIDGRTYNSEIFMQHQMVTGAAAGWEEILRKHEVTHIVTKTMDSSGMILPLVEKLVNDPQWELVFADGLFVVFARNIPQNGAIIRRFRLDKSAIPQSIIWESYHYTFLGVSPILVYNTQANMYLILGNRGAAIQALRKALELYDEPFLRNRLMQLEGQGPVR